MVGLDRRFTIFGGGDRPPSAHFEPGFGVGPWGRTVGGGQDGPPFHRPRAKMARGIYSFRQAFHASHSGFGVTDSALEKRRRGQHAPCEKRVQQHQPGDDVAAALVLASGVFQRARAQPKRSAAYLGISLSHGAHTASVAPWHRCRERRPASSAIRLRRLSRRRPGRPGCDQDDVAARLATPVTDGQHQAG